MLPGRASNARSSITHHQSALVPCETRAFLFLRRHICEASSRECLNSKTYLQCRPEQSEGSPPLCGGILRLLRSLRMTCVLDVRHFQLLLLIQLSSWRVILNLDIIHPNIHILDVELTEHLKHPRVGYGSFQILPNQHNLSVKENEWIQKLLFNP
jgi:hypothetical protein